jgi:hypothetical protein
MAPRLCLRPTVESKSFLPIGRIAAINQQTSIGGLSTLSIRAIGRERLCAGHDGRIVGIGRPASAYCAPVSPWTRLLSERDGRCGGLAISEECHDDHA